MSKLHTHPKHAQLRRCLEDSGEYEELVKEGAALANKKARTVLAERQDRSLHPEVAKQKAYQRKWALQVVHGANDGEPLAGEQAQSKEPPTRQPKTNPRSHKSKASLQLHHCIRCGSIDHNYNRCPAVQATSAATRLSDDQLVLSQDRRLTQRLHRITARLKYTAIAQRSAAYERRPRYRAQHRVAKESTFAAMCRARATCNARAACMLQMLPSVTP